MNKKINSWVGMENRHRNNVGPKAGQFFLALGQDKPGLSKDIFKSPGADLTTTTPDLIALRQWPLISDVVAKTATLLGCPDNGKYVIGVAVKITTTEYFDTILAAHGSEDDFAFVPIRVAPYNRAAGAIDRSKPQLNCWIVMSKWLPDNWKNKNFWIQEYEE
jgi:hypothetical protein